MRQETSLFARPKKTIWLICLIVAVLLIGCSIFCVRLMNNRKTYQEYQSLIPAAADVDSMDVFFKTDGTLIFTSNNMYSFMILGESSQISSLHSYTIGGNTINAIFLPTTDTSLNELVLNALDQGIDIRNIYVPQGTDQTFTVAVNEKNSRSKVIVCTGGEYQLFKDAMVYVAEGKGSLSLHITHGNNTFTYTHDKKVGTMLNKEETTVSFIPYDTFLESKISATYAIFRGHELDPEVLFQKTDYYIGSAGQTNIYCLSTGDEVSFDAYFIPTGRLKGE